MKWRILEGIPGYKLETQKMIVIACMYLHNWIRDSKLRDEHFSKFDNDAYVQPPLPFTGANNIPPEDDDGTMNTTREAIAATLIP
uniref:DDE Tnp4 domain-containing protein n=1 Tax=Aegilops tauschii subsp. strangulata TaxID=200361 RepID=A0A453ENW5_AEGTS